MAVNSDETESYHTWSSNGKWLVFSSKRLDGRSGRPFFAHIDSAGNQGKEFVLPQKDPSFYNRMLKSFNIPEFVNGKIEVNPRDFLNASRQEPLKARPGTPPDTLLVAFRARPKASRRGRGYFMNKGRKDPKAALDKGFVVSQGLFLAIAFGYFFFAANYVLYFQETQSLFIFSGEYLRQSLSKPGGPLVYGASS